MLITSLGWGYHWQQYCSCQRSVTFYINWDAEINNVENVSWLSHCSYRCSSYVSLSLGLGFFPAMLFCRIIHFRFFFCKQKETLGMVGMHYSEASETLSASWYSQFSSLLLACFGKFFGKQSSVLFNANESFAKVVHVDMKLEYNNGE